ncbi:alpha/beta fold hydrolase [Anaerocolumna jejuensis]|uniref:alpha/beta fold hydrolase n=1 Tax=Anaerocolumna jejuensis TaxID=259063 RepID=UPI003F7B4D70
MGTERLYAKINGNKPLPASILQYQKLIRNNFHYRHETIPLFSDKELAKLSMPTVLLAGRKDIMLHSEKTAARLETLLPQATICLLPEEGHSIVNPAEKIKEFL